MGSGIFRFIPITRKLKWRQFWNIKTVWGSLSDENNQLNNEGKFFKTLNNRYYSEIGTGIDNIFKVFRIDAVWNITPDIVSSPFIPSASKFGIFGSFKLQF
jgi:hypothetical protein